MLPHASRVLETLPHAGARLTKRVARGPPARCVERPGATGMDEEWKASGRQVGAPGQPSGLCYPGKIHDVARTSARHALPLQQRTNTITVPSYQELRPQVFHGGPFGVWGTPPTKPLNCKVWDFAFGARQSRADLLVPISKSVVVAFRYCSSKTKTLLTFGKQGLENVTLFLHLLTRELSKYIAGSWPGLMDSPRLNTQPWFARS